MRPTIDQQVTFLYTNDLGKSAEFYENILQLPLVLDQGACRIYSISNTAFLGVCYTEQPIDSTSIIVTLVSDQVDDWYKFLSAHNIPLEKPPTYNPKFNIYHLFLRDPNGYLIEIQTFRDPAWPSP